MAAQTYPEWIWHNGAVKPWREATVHVMAHALHYGSSVFEGIRSYKTPNGAAIFRLSDHLKRLYLSAKVYEMAIPCTPAELASACREVLKANQLEQAYLRPVAYRGLGGFGLSADTPIDVAVATWPMGPYLGPEALENGITACVSSWQRMAPNTIPAGAKAGGNYLSGQLIAREARRLGFGEGIALASTGLLSEGAGETDTMNLRDIVVRNALLHPDKLDIAECGDVVAQLHVHVIARFAHDAAWPAPVWGRGERVAYGERERAARIAELRTALGGEAA